jgi:flagellar P-ring protein precursor FlgI
LVEKEIPVAIFNAKNANLSLKKENFTDAVRVQNALNKSFQMQIAQALDSRNITLVKPNNLTMPEFLAKVQDVQVELTRHNRVVIDEKTGTIIAGADIPISPIVITHGDITVKVRADKTNQVKPDGKLSIDVGDGLTIAADNMIASAPKDEMTISTLMRALQKLGAKPKDIISIIESMKAEGALQADLEII